MLAAGGVAAAAEKVVYSFSGSPLGEIPEAGVIFDTAGNMYGTTMRGGTGNECGSGCGEVYELQPQGSGGWQETVLHSFDLAHGAYPDTPLVFDPSGNLYGVTQVGGALGEAYALQRGAHSWRFDVLHNFRGGRDGQQPRAPLVLDGSGDLYGTTVGGGSGGSGGNGTAFMLFHGSDGWGEDTLNRFRSSDRGAAPQAPLVFDPAGNLYGTTIYGGNTACAEGCGVVYELVPRQNGGRTLRVLHQFDGSDGYAPDAGLVPDGKGDFFGSTNEGAHSGCFGGCGVIFEISPNQKGAWRFTLLHAFDRNDGGGPAGPMVFDSAGNLFGSTVVGGDVKACPQQLGCGVVFELSPRRNGKWAYAVLHKFSSGSDGALPNGVTLDANGNLFGTTIGGGAAGLGVVFEVTP
jgi:uncharacterized repeat protein (TIGR03803 family)